MSCNCRNYSTQQTSTYTSSQPTMHIFENGIVATLFAGLIDGYTTALVGSWLVPAFGGQLDINRVIMGSDGFFKTLFSGFLGYVAAKVVKKLLPPYNDPYFTGEGTQSIMSIFNVFVQGTVNSLVVLGMLNTGIWSQLSAGQSIGLAAAGFIGLFVADMFSGWLADVAGGGSSSGGGVKVVDTPL